MKTTLSIIGIVVLAFFLLAAAGRSEAGGEMQWSAASKHAMAKKAEMVPPIMVSNDYLEFLEIENGIETGSLTAPGVDATEIAGPSTRVEIPEGG